jgi:hypothetical protein
VVEGVFICEHGRVQQPSLHSQCKECGGASTVFVNMGEYALNAKSTEVLFVNMEENAFIAKSAEVLQFVNMGDDRHEAKSVEDLFFL